MHLRNGCTGLRARGDIDHRAVHIKAHIDRRFAGAQGQSSVQYFIKRKMRPAWVGGTPIIRIERRFNFVMKDQRQPGDAKHQKEKG